MVKTILMVKMRMRMVKEMVFEKFMSLFNFEYYQCVFQTRYCCISNEKLWIGMRIMFNVYIPYFRDQTLRLLFISSRDFPRPLFEGGH